ncbi:MAG: hypothetical protein ACQGVC_11385 [Myxococcota bacterium]
MRRRLLDPFVGADPLLWRNTTRGLRLFVRAAFSGLEPKRLPERADDHLVSALFVFGAIDAASEWTHLPPRARRRLELGFLRRAYGVRRLRAYHVHRHVRTHAQTSHGRAAMREGRSALCGWFKGEDPAPRLRAWIERMPAEHLDVPRPRPTHVHRPPRRPAAVAR